MLFISTIIAGSYLLDAASKVPEMKEEKAVSDMVSALRSCRLEAIASNRPVKWWMASHYLAWWSDEDEDGLQEPEETETLAMSENILYATYPGIGTFDGRGEHSTNIMSFPGMVVWLSGDTAVNLVTVSSNGQVDSDTY